MRITFFVRDPRSKVAKASAELPLIIRLRNGQTDIWQNTRLSVNPAWWDKQRQQVRARLMLSPKLRQSVDNEVAAIRHGISCCIPYSKIPVKVMNWETNEMETFNPKLNIQPSLFQYI